MDYEKKYNEALAWMREMYPCLTDSLREDAEHYFPELRESEDETTRKELLNFVRSFWADHKEKLPQTSRWVTYLEKQKDLTKEDIIKQLEEEFYACGTTPKWFHDTVQGAINHGRAEALGEIKAHEPVSTIEQKEQKPADDKAFEEWIDNWWKHNKVNNPDSYDKGDEIQFDEKGFKNFCRGIRNMYQQKPAEWEDYKDKVNIPHCSSKPECGEELDIDTLRDWSMRYAPDIRQAIESTAYHFYNLRPSWKPSEEQMEAFRKYIEDFQARAEAAVGGWNNFDVMIRLYEQLKKL